VPKANLLAGASGFLCEWLIMCTVEHCCTVNYLVNIVLKLQSIASAEDSNDIFMAFGFLQYLATVPH